MAGIQNLLELFVECKHHGFRAKDSGLTYCTDCGATEIKGWNATSISRVDFRHAFGQAYCAEVNQNKELDAHVGIEIERILFGEETK